MDDLYWGIIGFVAVLSLMVLGVHVGLALATTGFVGMVVMTGKVKLALALFTTTPYSTTNVYAFAILPLFIIMGLFAMHAGLSARAFDAAYKWVGRLPGGMAIATTWANAMFAACTGSSVVACAVFTRISLPEMDRRGYDQAFACGTIAAAGMLGMLIPPSALMIVYGILTEQSIGKLLIAGVGPGVLLTLIFTAGIIIVAIRNPGRAPKADYAPPFFERLKATVGVVGIVILVVGIIAGMYTGIFTPTEAGAAGAAGALVLALIAPLVERWVFRTETAAAASNTPAANPPAVGGGADIPIVPPSAPQFEKPGLNWQRFSNAMKEAAQTSALVFFILIGAMIFARFLVLTGLPGEFVEIVNEANIPTLLIMILFLIMYVFLGMFQDSISMMSITLPIVHPIIVGLGIDPVYFAMLVIMSIEIGLITPPVGLNVYTVRSVAVQMPEGQNLTLENIFKGILPFFFLSIVALVILIAVPPISTFLPSKMFG
jgi:TRAP-type C4-dicarboxylate transport system permease large subunit